jgi:N-acyl amino acid synthase of PEP-CTERM/exosortase system
MKSSTLASQRCEGSYDIAEHFQQYFSVSPATTTALKQAVYRLRYDVYCREFNYEPAENFPDGMERDEYDSQALHVLVRHKNSGLAAGCTRIITPDPSNAAALLPVERYCSGSLDADYLDNLNLSRQSICEASRLSVSNIYRRRHGESRSRYGSLEHLGFSPQEQRTFPLISVSISLATTALTELTGHPYMFAMMEPSLPRLLQRIGYNFKQVGVITNYHGKRAAYLQETSAVLENLRPELRDLYCEIRKSLKTFA